MTTEELSTSSPKPQFVMMRLSIMNFLQFFVWGSWFVTIGQGLGSNGLENFIGGTFGTAPYGAIFAPLFLGLIADRFFPSQIIFGALFLIGGVFMFLASGAAADGNGQLMVTYILGHMLCFMPCIGLGNTIGFSHLSLVDYPKVRVWGVVGWIVAGLLVGFLEWSSNLNVLLLAAGASLVTGIFSFFLPHTPAPAKGEKIDLRALLMVDAWKLLAKPSFLIFILCSGVICIPLAYYYAYGAPYLTNTGFVEVGATMTLGQMLEAVFMVMIPFFFRKWGVKWMILIGMAAWVIRYLLFAFGAPDQVTWMLLAGVALHGICYDFFFVSGFMYTDAVASKKIRGQAQSLLVFVTQGLGMFIGVKIAAAKFAEQVPQYGALDGAIKQAATSEGGTSVIKQLSQMFSREIPATVDSQLVATTMDQWKSFWAFPAILAAVVLVIFLITFRDNTKVE